MAANPLPTPLRTLTVDVTTSDGVPTLNFHGRITTETSGLFKSKVKELFPQYRVIIADLSGVEYVDSSGLGIILATYVSAKSSGCQLKFVNLSARVKDLLRITGLASIFQGYGEYL